MSRKKISFALKVFVSVFFVLWLVFKVDWSGVLENIKHVQGMFLFWYIALVILGIAISARKWQSIAYAKGFYRDWWPCFRAYLTGAFINNFLPSFIGGDTYRAYWLGKQRDGYSRAVSTVVFDRFTGLFSAVILAVIFSLVEYRLVEQSFVWSLIVALLCALIVGIFVWSMVWRRLYALPMVQLVIQFLPGKMRIFLVEVKEFFQKDVFVATLSWSFAFNIIGVGLANWILFQAFGQSISLPSFFSVIFLISIVASIPVSVNNIGIKEWAYYTFFSLIGVNPNIAVTVAIVSRFVQMLISFFAFPDFLRRKNIQE